MIRVRRFKTLFIPKDKVEKIYFGLLKEWETVPSSYPNMKPNEFYDAGDVYCSIKENYMNGGISKWMVRAIEMDKPPYGWYAWAETFFNALFDYGE